MIYNFVKCVLYIVKSGEMYIYQTRRGSILFNRIVSVFIDMIFGIKSIFFKRRYGGGSAFVWRGILHLPLTACLNYKINYE